MAEYGRKGGPSLRDERLYTVAQVAERLQVNPETVRRWLRSGELRGRLLGDKAGYRVEEGDLRNFIEQRKIAA
jgi:excisionase family DNA binding protein